MKSEYKIAFITGFEPYSDNTKNPTQDLALFYHGQVIGEYRIVGVTLPSTFHGCFEKLEPLIDDHKPDLIISLGLSTTIKALRVEISFRNNMNGKYPDNDGYDPKDIPITAGGMEFIPSTFNSIDVANLFYTHDIPVFLSGNASGFVCNSLGYYISKKIQEENLATKNILIHIPWTDDYIFEVNLPAEKIFLDAKYVHQAIDLILKNF